MKPVSRAMQLVGIDAVVSTATMTANQTIGFLYTTGDGGTWLGERTGALHVRGERDLDQRGLGRDPRRRRSRR